MSSARQIHAGLLNILGRALGAGALMVLFGLLAWQAGKEALSEAHLQSASLELNQSAMRGPQMQQEAWMRAMQSLTESLRHSPRNPRALEEMGAHNLRRMRARTDAKLPMVAITGANINFHLALKERPTSPVAWANLALTKYFLNQIDEEFFNALRFADELGPSEFDIQEWFFSSA